MKKTIQMLVFILFVTSCASIPVQVVDAVAVQKKEIERVKALYFNNMNNQLDAIKKYRLAILDNSKKELLEKYSRAPNVKVVNGKQEPVMEDATGNINVDYINIGLLKKIETFFSAERKKVLEDVQKRRVAIQKANQNFENIEKVNTVLNNYLQSLERLKTSRDKLAKAIKKQVDKILPISISLDDLPNPHSIEDIITKLNIK